MKGQAAELGGVLANGSDDGVADAEAAGLAEAILQSRDGPDLAAEPNVHTGTFPATAPPDDDPNRPPPVLLRPLRRRHRPELPRLHRRFPARTVRGGILLFDDYGWWMCPGVERALREAFGSRRVIQSANDQAAVIC